MAVNAMGRAMGLLNVNCTERELMANAITANITFLNLPVNPLSKSTKPPAMMPKISAAKYCSLLNRHTK